MKVISEIQVHDIITNVDNFLAYCVGYDVVREIKKNELLLNYCRIFTMVCIMQNVMSISIQGLDNKIVDTVEEALEDVRDNRSKKKI